VSYGVFFLGWLYLRSHHSYICLLLVCIFLLADMNFGLYWWRSLSFTLARRESCSSWLHIPRAFSTPTWRRGNR